MKVINTDIYNAHGDVVGLVDDNGNIKNTYTYDPWGNILSETETIDNPIKYAGEYYDDELDMIYLRARYYNPQIGRFTSYDIEEGLDMNRYKRNQAWVPFCCFKMVIRTAKVSNTIHT